MGGWTGVGKDRINWNGQMEQRELVPHKDNDLVTKKYTDDSLNDRIGPGTAAGQWCFWDIGPGFSKWSNTETSEIRWDDLNKRLGVGTASPSTLLDVDGTASMNGLGILTSIPGKALEVNGDAGYQDTADMGATDTDFASKKYVDDNAGGVGGNDTEVQYNDGGSVAGDAKLFWDKVNSILGTDILEIPTTSATAGQIKQDGDILLHTFYDPTNAVDRNIFLGKDVGNFTLSAGGGASHLSTENVGIGNTVLGGLTTGYRNVGIGYNIMPVATTALQNTGIGYAALLGLTTGNSNVAIGATALAANTSGFNNFGMGTNALRFTTTGNNNVGIGAFSVYRNTTSSSNVGIGGNCFQNGTGANNVAIGGSAAASVSGSGNIHQSVYIGRNAGQRVISGASRNVYLGYCSGCRQTSTADQLIIDNVDRTTAALEKTDALVYGDFSTDEIRTGKILHTSLGGIAIKLTNKTGANSVAGQLVKPDTATDDAVILTATSDQEIIGVFLDSGVADGSEAWVVINGIADVRFEDGAAAARGDWVSQSLTGAGDAVGAAGAPGAVVGHFREVGHCIETVATGGAGTFILARCVLHFN